jgi:hypothetical protein
MLRLSIIFIYDVVHRYGMDINTYVHGKWTRRGLERYGHIVMRGNKKERCIHCKRWTYVDYLIRDICMDCRYRKGLGLIK